MNRLDMRRWHWLIIGTNDGQEFWYSSALIYQIVMIAYLRDHW